MNVPALLSWLSLMCFVLRQTQRDNESPHPWDLAGHERVVGGVDKHPSLCVEPRNSLCCMNDPELWRRVAEKKISEMGASDPNKAEYYARPAKKQALSEGASGFQDSAAKDNYNIWYNRSMGERRGHTGEHADARCVIAQDAGLTRADFNSKSSHFCLHFARGKCSNGADCRFYHRLPTGEESDNIPLTVDVFGRERHKNHREDMSGVGSFGSREDRTLFLGHLKLDRSTDAVKDIKKVMQEWGFVDYVKVVFEKSIAFVRFHHRAHAEFAKEAMLDQSLHQNGTDVISVRWAIEDPRQGAQARLQKEEQAKLVKAVVGPTVKPHDVAEEIHHQHPVQVQVGFVQGNDGNWYYWDGQQYHLCPKETATVPLGLPSDNPPLPP